MLKISAIDFTQQNQLSITSVKGGLRGENGVTGLQRGKLLDHGRVFDALKFLVRRTVDLMAQVVQQHVHLLLVLAVDVHVDLVLGGLSAGLARLNVTHVDVELLRQRGRSVSYLLTKTQNFT